MQEDGIMTEYQAEMMLSFLEQIRDDLAKLRLDVATLLAMKGPVVEKYGQVPGE